MRTVLHLGAHRTGTTTFQSYVRRHGPALRAQGMGFWGPFRTRGGLFSGVTAPPHEAYRRGAAARARGRVQMQLDKAADAGIDTLLISEENMLGNLRNCVAGATLYPDVGERMARFAATFDGRIDRVVVTIRSLDLWWRSGLAYVVGRGRPVPRRARLAQIAGRRRSWQDVISDIACALPEGTDIGVQIFEEVMGRPDLTLKLATGIAGPVDLQPEWLNAAPDLARLRALLEERGSTLKDLPADDGRWLPFDTHEDAALREQYADDLFWLTAGADGLARRLEDPTRTARANGLALSERITRGRGHVAKDGALAQSG